MPLKFRIMYGSLTNLCSGITNWMQVFLLNTRKCMLPGESLPALLRDYAGGWPWGGGDVLRVHVWCLARCSEGFGWCLRSLCLLRVSVHVTHWSGRQASKVAKPLGFDTGGLNMNTPFTQSLASGGFQNKGLGWGGGASVKAHLIIELQLRCHSQQPYIRG